MTKEIIVNAGELESRVAILENGRLMELHVEREPKIVGNIYKGRVTKVLKGMDAAFVDIGIERNAFLAASDVVSSDDEDTGNSQGRISRANLPPINELLHANQEVLVQVVRAPLGTKGARVTTRLSLPGRYMVLMLNSGSYVGVSRKIEDSKERQRLRALATELRPEDYSLIVRTEAEGKTEDELRQDMVFLLDMAHRIEKKAAISPTPSLVHGDLTLIFRLIRDAFTRDVNRMVVDSPTTYENVLELVGLIAPHMKNRVFLYDERMPIFHTYNVEQEIERTLRRKVWLPSGGTLIVDQAEALTAIDVNTGRFVGSVELAETVLTTNLQAAEEVARQLRLRDLGGIIVVDFIDMDNPRHRQQVMKVFEEALRRDRAKLKVHSISPLGLVEMTRKRTGESLVRLLTEPCPYCSGIGRVQNSLTMALRVERELAATAVEHPEAEAYMITAHPRVIASMLGYEGEAHHDLELYLERPVYLRIEDDFHPNTYRLDRLTLEQAYQAVKRLEEGQVVEGQVVNPDPEVSLSPLVQCNGIYLIVPDLDAPVGARVKVRVKDAGTSVGIAEPLAVEQRGIRMEEMPFALQRPPLVPESVLPTYLREERATVPPRGLQLLSPTAEAVPEPIAPLEETAPLTPTATLVESANSRRRKRSRRRKQTPEELAQIQTTPELAATTPVSVDENALAEIPVTEVVPVVPAGETGELAPTPSKRRRRRRRGRGGAEQAVVETPSAEGVLDVVPTSETLAVAAEEPVQEEEFAATVEPERPARRRRASRRRRTEPTATEAPTAITEPESAQFAILPIPAPPEPTPPSPMLSAEEATRAMLDVLNAIPETGEAITSEETPVETPAAPVEESPVAKKPRRTARRRTTQKANVEQTELVPETPLVETVDATPLELAPKAIAPPEAPAVEEAMPAVEQPESTPVKEKPKRKRPATTGTAPKRRTRKIAEPSPVEPTEGEGSVTE